MFLALAQGRDGHLVKLAAETPLSRRYSAFFDDHEANGQASEELAWSLPANDRFGKAAAVWRSERIAHELDRKTLKGVSCAMARFLEEKGLARAEACGRFRLDKGNLCAFLKGDIARLGGGAEVKAYRTLLKMTNVDAL